RNPERHDLHPFSPWAQLQDGRVVEAEAEDRFEDPDPGDADVVAEEAERAVVVDQLVVFAAEARMMDAVLGLVERDGAEERQPVEKLQGVMQPAPAEEVVVRGLVKHRLAERELEETDDPDGDDVEGPMTNADARRGHPDD